MSDVQNFYDTLAHHYTSIFADWQQSVERQGRILRTLLENLGEPPPRTILDCTCGIGTQAFGLAQQGYHVHGTDLSPDAITKAHDYQSLFDLPQKPTFAVADLLHPPHNPSQYDIVLSADNAIAHFHSNDELQTALHTMQTQTVPGGLICLTCRDYDVLAAERPAHSGITCTTDSDGHKHIVFQTWDWDDDRRTYRMEMFFLNESDSGWQTVSSVSHLRAWQRDEVSAAMQTTGMQNITWHMPPDTGYYQPIVTGRR